MISTLIKCENQTSNFYFGNHQDEKNLAQILRS